MKDSERAPNPDAGPNMSLAARADVLEQDVFANSEMAYARNVEVRSQPAPDCICRHFVMGPKTRASVPGCSAQETAVTLSLWFSGL